MTLDTGHKKKVSHQCGFFCVPPDDDFALMLNPFGHWWQGKGFSPVLVLLWTTSLSACLNVLGH